MTDDNTLERVAIAGATAIQHIIAERNDLRNRTHVQQQEHSPPLSRGQLLTQSGLRRVRGAVRERSARERHRLDYVLLTELLNQLDANAERRP